MSVCTRFPFVVSILCLVAPLSAQRSDPEHREAMRAGFGAAVAVSGDEVFVGEPSNRFRSGVVYVYRERGRATGNAGGGWREVAQLVASDSATGDRFGRAIAVDGDHLLVGADPDRGRSTGAVHAFARDASGRWRAAGVLLPADGAAGDGFGATIVLAGDLAVIGAPGHADGRGAAYRFTFRDGTWEPAGMLVPSDTSGLQGYGGALALAGEWLLVGAPGSDGGSGAVVPFRRADGAWVAGDRLVRDGPADTTAAFGGAIALDGRDLFIGAPGVERGSGSVSRFALDTVRQQWRPRGAVAPFDGARGGGFGGSLALTAAALWVGAPGAADGGQVHVYSRSGDRLTGVTALRAPDEVTDRAFGGALAVHGDRAAVGISGAAIGAGRAVVLSRSDTGWVASPPLESPPESLASVLGPEVRCTDSTAAGWDCRNVDLVSFLPVSAIGGVRGMRLNDLWGWTDSTTGREYVIIGRSDGTSFVDMTDPANPRYLGDLPMTPGSRAAVWRDMKVYRDHAYIVADGAGQHGVQVFDLDRLRRITTPQVFEPDFVYTSIASAHNIVINEATGFAYVVGASAGGTMCGGGLHMLDLKPDRKRPTFVGCFSDGVTGRRGTGYSHDAQCVVYRGPDRDYQGREICIGSNETALSLADVTDKANPRSIATVSYPNVAYAHQGWLSDDQQWFFSNDEIDEANGSEPHTRTLVWDLADLDDPVLAAEYRATTTETDHNLYVHGRYMYQSNTGAGLRVIDVIDPRNPVEVGFFDTDREGTGGGTWSNYPYFASGVIPVTGGFAGIFFVRPRPEVVP